MINLKNTSYARVNNETTTIVAAGANSAGIKIHLITVSCRASSGNNIKFGENFLYQGNPSIGDSDTLKFENILIPAGMELSASAISSDSFICISYEVLS